MTPSVGAPIVVYVQYPSFVAVALVCSSCCFGGQRIASAPQPAPLQAPPATPLAPIAVLEQSACYVPTGAAIVRDGSLRVHCRHGDGTGSLRTYSLPDLTESARSEAPVDADYSAFSEDGSVVALLASSEVVVLRDGVVAWRRTIDQRGNVLALSPDGAHVVFTTISFPEAPHSGLPVHDTLHVVRVADEHHVMQLTSQGTIDSAIFTPGSEELYVAEGWMGRVYRWRVVERALFPWSELRPYGADDQNVGVTSLALSPDGRSLAAVTNRGLYFSIAIETSSVTSSGHDDWDSTATVDFGAPSAAWSAATNHLYVAAGATALAVCDPTDGHVLAAHTYRVAPADGLPRPRVATSADGARLVILMDGVYVLDAP